LRNGFTDFSFDFTFRSFHITNSNNEIEAEISKAITQWEKDFLGRGSLSVKSDILRDMVIISLKMSDLTDKEPLPRKSFSHCVMALLISASISPFVDKLNVIVDVVITIQR
jgi:hypothetical protein